MHLPHIISSFLYNFQYDFNEDKYWKRRLYLQKGDKSHNVLSRWWWGVKRIYFVLYCRRIEAKKCASTGIGEPDNCCQFADKPFLPHGLNGIVIGRNVEIGKKVSIFQHVTIAESNKHLTTVIGDNVMIGAGAVILNNVKIGKGAKIGANAVVTKEVPDGSIAIGVPAKIIYKK